MHFDTEKCKFILGLWKTCIVEPWAGGFILGLQGNFTDQPNEIFTLVHDVWSWRINSLFELIAKPIVLLIVLTISLTAFSLKLAVMLAFLPLWIFIAVTASIKSGYPDYPQTWVSIHD